MNTLTEALSKLANIDKKPQEEKVVLTEGQKELKESLEKKLSQVNKNNYKNSFELSKVYEKAIQEGINNLYPDVHWSQITKANIMATLLENKNDVNKTVDKIVNESTLNELFGLGKYVLKYGKSNSQIFIGSQKDCQQQLNTLKELLKKPEYAGQKYILSDVSIEKWKGGNRADEGGAKAFLSRMKKYSDDVNAKERERKNREEEAKRAAEKERAARNKKSDDEEEGGWRNRVRHNSRPVSSGHYNRDGSWQYESLNETLSGSNDLYDYDQAIEYLTAHGLPTEPDSDLGEYVYELLGDYGEPCYTQEILDQIIELAEEVDSEGEEEYEESLNESKSLNEDTPEDLRKAITRDSYTDDSYRGRHRGLRGSSRYFQAREYGDNVDFAASDAQEVDPKDALKAQKAGEDMSKYFLMMNNGQTVQLDKWGHPEQYNALTTGGDSERENASLKTMLGKAAKVYKYDYKLAKDTHPERFADGEERRANLRRGSMRWDTREWQNDEDARKYHQYLQYKGDKDAIDAARKAYEDGDISRKEMERRIERAQGNGPSDWERKDAAQAYNNKRNQKAADTYYASNKKLQEPIKRLANLRWQLRDAQRDLNYTRSELAQARGAGDSYYVKKAEEVRQQIASLQRSLKHYENEIAKSQSTATIADYEKKEAGYQAQMNQIQADLDALLRRNKTESFREEEKKALKESVKVDQHFVLHVDSEEEAEKTVDALKKKGFSCDWNTEEGESGAYIEVFGGTVSEEVTNAILKELGLNEADESLEEAKDLDKRKGSFANEIQSNKEVKAEFEQAANLGKAKGLEHMLKAIEKANISDDTKKKLSAKVRGTSAAGWLSMLGTMSTGEKVIK